MKRLSAVAGLLCLAFMLSSCFGGGGHAQFDGLYFGLEGDLNNGIIGGTGGRVATTTDSGSTWFKLNISFSTSELSGDSLASKTITPPSLPTPINWDVSDLDFKDGWTGVIVGDGGNLILTTDAGNSWNEIDLGITTKLRGIKWDFTLSAAYTFGDEGVVFRSDDDGITWAPQITPDLKIIYGGCFLDDQKGWLVGEDGLFLGTDDGGANWDEIVPRDINGDPIDLSGIRLRDCWWGTNMYGFVIGENGTFLRTEDDGIIWTKIDLGTTAEFRKINFNTNFGFMVGDPYIGRTLDWGETWYSVPLSSGQKFALAIKDLALNLDKAWAVGENDYFYSCEYLSNAPSDPDPPICVQTKIAF